MLGDARRDHRDCRREPAVRRFFGTVTLNPTRVGRDAGRIAEEVISHLVGQVGADVTRQARDRSRPP